MAPRLPRFDGSGHGGEPMSDESDDGYVPPKEWARIFERERAEIARSRTVRGVGPDDRLVGLAVSGGGIRSATFALGVVQALAKQGQLKRFDYLSTVSGGGYLGSSISWLLRRADPGQVHGDFGLGADDFPYGAQDPGGRPPHDAPWQSAMLRFLRQHGNYLAPGKGITLIAATSVVLRSIFLNLLVWVPLLVAVMVPIVLCDDASKSFQWPSEACCGPVACDQGLVHCTGTEIHEPEAWPLSGLRKVAGWLLVVFAAFAALYSLIAGVPRLAPDSRLASLTTRYLWRRRSEIGGGVFLLVTIVVAVVASLPWVASYLGREVASAGSVAAVLLGSVSGLRAFFRTGSSSGPIPVGFIATFGSTLLLYGILLLAYLGALTYAAETHGTFGWPPESWTSSLSLLAAATAGALLLGFCVNLNHSGLHRFYRDRLMETFMPPVDEVLEEPAGDYTGPSTRADGCRLSQLHGDGHRAPYHLVNTNVVLVDSANRRYRIRGGESFTLSPLYSGSEATGWRRTSEFMADTMTLATAMAISGAAANPNTGAGGVGPTRARGVSLLMSLLNIRLGYWVKNPQRRQWLRTPNHFDAARYELSPRGYRETGSHLQLSDGGHFENLGLYELVRRKAALIVVLDGAADKGFQFGDLQIAARRIAEDFGARIEFDPDNHLEKLIPRQEVGYPVGFKQAERGFIEGEIIYSEGPSGKVSGRLLYVKSTRIPGLGLRVKGYQGSHRDFPDESTADQFFDEAQFEAYRELGYRIGESVKDRLAALIQGTAA